MIDTNLLKNAVRNFESSSRPSNASMNDECTIGELNRVISNTAKMMNVFIKEIEGQI